MSETMKRYYAQVLANQDVRASAKNRREARKKIIAKFKKNPGRAEIVDIIEEGEWGYF
jgi:hypothetical protein